MADKYGGFWTNELINDGKSHSMFAVDAPPAYRTVYVGPGGTKWNSLQEYLNGSGQGGSAGGGYGVAAASPATATYVAPRTVDQTNSYEGRLNTLLDNPDAIANTGAYKFRFNQGQQAIERSAAAKGMTGSGNILAELAKYGQGMASQAYDTEADRLGNLSGQQKNYILGLLNNAQQESATANQFNLGNTRNANDFTLGSQRNNIDYMRMQNDALNGARRYGTSTSGGSGGNLFSGGTFGGDGGSQMAAHQRAIEEMNRTRAYLDNY